MDYVIAVTKQIQGCLEVELSSAGNKYRVGIYNNKTMEYAKTYIVEWDDAVALYLEIIKLVVNGAKEKDIQKTITQ